MQQPIRLNLNTPIAHTGATITTGTIYRGALGFELWGDTGPTSETHLDTLYYANAGTPEAITNWIDAHGQII